jgi:hypothetical protein
LTNVTPFALEEYKAIQEKVKIGRDILTRLETVTIGGVAVAVGILLGISPAQPGVTSLFAWWSAVFILIAAFVRCWAYYTYIGRLQSYLMQIEDLMKKVDGYELQGFENYNRSKVAGPVAGYVVNIAMWAIAIGGVLWLAVAKTAGYPVP